MQTRTPTDCSSCEALCCVLLAFDRSDLFAFDKPAGVPCPHLNRRNHCRIHDERAELGFGGCVTYDCDGAGPRACSAASESWRDGEDAMRRLYDAFA